MVYTYPGSYTFWAADLVVGTLPFPFSTMANANYLPVLLQSVSNAVPDDSYVNSQPKGQVDYLSHEWQEEDVWKSWRNMTRQKNEIANGVRLENASWRTWWKQRNKLKTVSPETLNWLKDSDVTWLYGPLHTWIEDKPVPKPPSPAESPSNLDQKPLHKPILKHRSISQLLTSDLPTSPIFSPADSEDDEEEDGGNLHAALRHDISPSQHPSFPKRPTLLHTKSDTHITRWGPNRAFRKDSPPRIDPPGQHDVEGYFPPVSAGGLVQPSQSQDSNSSSNGERTTKKKHITFNTFVEQCIAIEKPKRSASFYGEFGKTFEDDDGYEEDQEDSPEDDAEVTVSWGGQRLAGDSDSDSPYEEDDDVIEMRTSYRDKPKKLNPRSQSKVSNTSSSSSVSTASSRTNSTTNSSSPPRTANPKRKPTARRASTTSTYRTQSHVTIAPIAPTTLKTTGAWEEGFGDDASDDGFGWRERMWVFDGKKPRSKLPEEVNLSSEGTPVELVYVPPFNSRYTYEYDIEEYDDGPLGFEDEEGYDDEDMLDEDFVAGIAQDASADDVYHHRGSVIGSVGFEDYSGSPDSHSSIPIPIPSNHLPDDAPTVENHENLDYGSRMYLEVPKVVVDSQRDEDRFGSFDGPDLGEEYIHLGSSGSRQSYRSRPPSRSYSSSQSGSRGRSSVRTPSSAFESSTSPLGSLSPDASISPGRVAVGAYVGNGRLRGEKESKRGRDEGRDRGRGRSQTTDKRLSVSLSNSPEPPRHIDACVASPVISRASSGHAPTEASCDSIATGSSVSSTKTVVPEDKEEEEIEANEVEEEQRRRTMPTPSNSPTIEMRSAIPNHLRAASSPPKGSFLSSRRSMSPASASPPTGAKNRPPPLAPSPPITVPPSTNSYTAISSPTSPRTVVPPHLITSAVVVTPPAHHHLPATEVTRPPLNRSQSSDSSIIGKAADMVSSAGAFLGFWNH
ncbi:hypothetical protein BKA70DRAFT_1179029 [Coprinopsis sp. MPI-PUGE-AT-0042]|nr:hypothetical protein BKA70DRAFT_1179029 [Coprinopsis sp. MPI-PUGE-AT-0042]